jgi:hypothetical protein
MTALFKTSPLRAGGGVVVGALAGVSVAGTFVGATDGVAVGKIGNGVGVAVHAVVKIKIPKIQIRQKLSLVRNKKLVHSTLADNPIFPNLNQEKKTPKQIPSLEIQNINQEGQSTKLAKKCKEPSTKLPEKYEEPSESNGCPKNLDYYTKRPRPKQMPEECFTCRNLITCVCLTDQ